jgi:hypothetical protein
LRQAATGNDAIANCNRCNQKSKPSLIAMDLFNAIIVKRQSAHETSIPLMQQGELWQLALEPQGGLANERNKGVMRTS